MDADLTGRIERSIGNIPRDAFGSLKSRVGGGNSASITQYMQGKVLIALAGACRASNGDGQIISEAEALVAAAMGERLVCPIVAEIGYSNMESVHVAVTVRPV